MNSGAEDADPREAARAAEAAQDGGRADAEAADGAAGDAGDPGAAGGQGAAGGTGGAAADGGAAAALAEVRARAEEYLQSLQRLKADFDNYRRRVGQEQARWGDAAVAAFIAQILPIVDNMERASAASGDAGAVRQGVEMTLRQLRDVLAGAGVVAVDSVGQSFDPERHEAVTRGPAPGMAEGTVAEEYRRGYVMRGAVLRPALVKVATTSEAGAAAEAAEAGPVRAAGGDGDGDAADPAAEGAGIREGER